MIALENRALAVFVHAWNLLPSLKYRAFLTSVGIKDLGARHGSYTPDDGHLVINTRLFGTDTPQSIPLFDINSQDPPHDFPCVSRALATTLHELFHAIGTGTGLDQTPEWLALSQFVQAWDDPPGTARYCEQRPGWPMGFSAWRYAVDSTFFTREYSAKSPAEDFADCCTHLALGWHALFLAPEPCHANALAKRAYLRREVWGEKGIKAVHAAAQRWHARMTLSAARQTRTSVVAQNDDVDILEDAIREANEETRREVMTWLPRRSGAFLDHHAAVLAMVFALGPRLLRIYKRQWAQLSDMPPIIAAPHVAMVQRAAESYINTTERELSDVINPSLPATEMLPFINHVYERSNTTRARQMAQTEAHRMKEAAQEAVWRASGEVEYKVWRVQSANPCSFCVALDGTRVIVGEPFFLKGATIRDGAGKTQVLDYDDVEHPPLHPACQCTLESQ